MPWKEPGKGDKDPWSSGNQQPPDLEEVFRNVNNRLRSIFGGSGGGGKSKSDSSGAGGTPVNPRRTVSPQTATLVPLDPTITTPSSGSS